MYWLAPRNISKMKLKTLHHRILKRNVDVIMVYSDDFVTMINLPIRWAILRNECCVSRYLLGEDNNFAILVTNSLISQFCNSCYNFFNKHNILSQIPCITLFFLLVLHNSEIAAASCFKYFLYKEYFEIRKFRASLNVFYVYSVDIHIVLSNLH